MVYGKSMACPGDEEHPAKGTGARATLWAAMTAEAVQALMKNTIRLQQASVVLASNAEGLIALSRELRLRHRAVRQEHVGRQAETYPRRLHWMVSRKLRTGRLPHTSAAILCGVPGSGGGLRCLRPTAYAPTIGNGGADGRRVRESPRRLLHGLERGEVHSGPRLR